MSNFVYVNENTSPDNFVAAFVVNSSNQLIPLSPPTYSTGGNGSHGSQDAQNSSICQLGSFLYVVNSGDNPTTISGFQIIPSTGALSSLFSPPVSTGDTSGSGLTGELLCSPNGQFLYVLNSGPNNITIYDIHLDGTLAMVGSPFPADPIGGLEGAVITPDGKFLLVCYSNSTSVGVFSIANDGSLSNVANSPFNFPHGQGSIGIAITNDGKYIFVAQVTAIVTIQIDSGGQLSQAATFGGPSISNVDNVIVSVDNKYLFASDNGTRNALSFTIGNDGGLTQLSTQPSDNNTYLYLTELNRDGTLLYVGGFDSTLGGATVSIFTIDNNGMLGTVQHSPFPLANPNLDTVITGLVSFPPPITICFLEGSKILCYQNNQEIYLPVEKLEKKTLVKTLKNGYLPIKSIGTSKVYNSENNANLRRCPRENYGELFEDLVITNGHAILVDDLTEEQRSAKVYVTDGKYRLMASNDDRTMPYEKEGLFDVYHFALDGGDKYRNYGVFANGLLVESCFENTIKDNMKMAH